MIVDHVSLILQGYRLVPGSLGERAEERGQRRESYNDYLHISILQSEHEIGK